MRGMGAVECAELDRKCEVVESAWWCHFLFTFQPTLRMTTWLWVKKGYLNNPIGKRTNRPKPVVPKRFLFDP